MRLRKVKNAGDKIAQYPNIVILDPKEHKGNWNKLFGNDNPIHIEIGCGKGRFAIGMAKANPNINYIAFEKYDSVLVRALELYLTDEQPNLRFVLADAQEINEYFVKDEVKQIHLNFSDPWPKKCHSKRRLTSSLFLAKYKEILPVGGKIIQKTDNKGLFAFSIEEYSKNNLLINKVSLDLHSEDMFNVMTEFEEKWSKLGPIYYAEVIYKGE